MDVYAVADFSRQVAATQEAYLGLLDRLGDSVLYTQPPDGGWTIAETLVHISEARRFFVNETKKVIASPGAQMGRTIDDPGRISNIEVNGKNSLGQVREALTESYTDLASMLKSLAEADLLITGEHVKFGSQSLGEFIQHFIVEHDQAHLEQTRELIRSLSG
jgi:uncharacterized damage-inducible protein DinB